MDDEDSFRQVITRFLSQRGFEVVPASNGEMGVRLAAEILPDLIICDLTMPGMSGHDVLAALRRDPQLADIPLIFLTGQTQHAQVRRSMNLGADDYLTKPVDLADLLSAIQVRLARRQEQRQRQEQHLERATQLFQGILHDLRDPLFVVLGYTDLLRSGADRKSGPGQEPARILERIQQAGLRMQTILAQTLALARSRVQQLSLAPDPVDLRVFCEQLIAQHEQGKRLRLESPPEPLCVLADLPRLRQAIENLLSNALKYSDGPVTVCLSGSAQACLIEVRDQGIGIPPDEQAGIFEPFFRASNAGNRPGHGLGLSIIKSCAEQHGGTVKFHSRPGQGTSFTVALPRWSASKPPLRPGAPMPAKPAVPVKAEPTASSTPSAPGAKLRGIIVDDDSLVRSLMRDILETSPDINVVGEAGTLTQARALVKQYQPNVVLLDVRLPDASGLELLADLKPGTSVVFVTSAEEYAVQAFDCDAVDYLLKPITPERLQKALARVRQRLDQTTADRARPSTEHSFLVKTLTEKRLVRVNDIERIIAYGEYSWVYWRDNKKGALLRKPLGQWVRELPPEQFVRVHRRAIVNLECLERVERLPKRRMQVHLRNTPEPIPVSLRLAALLNRRLKGRHLAGRDRTSSPTR